MTPKKMQDTYLKNILTSIIIGALLVLSFLVLKPILLYILLGFILAFIFSPVYNFVFKITKSPNFSATIISALLIILIILPFWFFTPMILDQAFKIYVSAQQIDFTASLKSIFPFLFASEQFSAEAGAMIHSFVSSAGNSLLDWLSKIILNFPTILLHSLVVFFTFFFALRDKEKISRYLMSLSPFSKDIEKKLFHASKGITSSVLYGQVILGIAQGIVVAIGFFLFGVPNAFILALLATIAGILPIVGPMLLWIPVVIFLLIDGNNVAAIGVLMFGLVGSNVDTILRPLFVSKMTKIHSAVVLIGMIGGLFLFGVLGLILGPLILSYLLIILEVYRDKSPTQGGLSSLLKGE